jgi:hypothetical protein
MVLPELSLILRNPARAKPPWAHFTRDEPHARRSSADEDPGPPFQDWGLNRCCCSPVCSGVGVGERWEPQVSHGRRQVLSDKRTAWRHCRDGTTPSRVARCRGEPVDAAPLGPLGLAGSLRVLRDEPHARRSGASEAPCVRISTRRSKAAAGFVKTVTPCDRCHRGSVNFR